MEYKSCSDKYIWSADDSYFYKGLSELIVDIDELIYLSLEKIRKDFVFINLNTASLNEFIRRDSEWLSAVKGKQVVLIAARKSEALANYWYYNSDIRGVVYVGLSRDIRKELAYVINGRFLRKDIKKDKITDREMKIIRMTAQGMQPKSIAISGEMMPMPAVRRTKMALVVSRAWYSAMIGTNSSRNFSHCWSQPCGRSCVAPPTVR